MKNIVQISDPTIVQRVIISVLGILMYAALLTSCSSGVQTQCSAYDEIAVQQ